MSKKGLSITMIFKAGSLNYGEGIGNISELKKLSRGDGSIYTFASRQALRYDIARLGNKMFDWNLETVDKAQGTVQFKKGITIKESEEMDLFGYLKTLKGDNAEVRSAAVRLSHAISLEEYKSEMEFLSNKGFADRIYSSPNPVNIEHHFSYYTYTVTIDLEKIGVDGDVEISNEEKASRVVELLEILKVLNREIRGREENLSPVFVVGGMYDINSPFFLGRIKLEGNNGEFNLNLNLLEDTMKLKLGNNEIANDTSVGIIKNEFKNEEDIEKLFKNQLFNIQEFFERLENQVKEYYK